MPERSQPPPGEGGRPPDPLPKTADHCHDYLGYWHSEGYCRIRVFVAAARTSGMLATELPDKPSTSIINLVEYLAPEIIVKHFPHR